MSILRKICYMICLVSLLHQSSYSAEYGEYSVGCQDCNECQAYWNCARVARYAAYIPPAALIIAGIYCATARSNDNNCGSSQHGNWAHSSSSGFGSLSSSGSP